MATRRAWIAATILALIGGSGCNLAVPRLFPAGTLQQQRYRAILQDPYADNDIGPKVEGGRPREFEKPLPEPVRASLMCDILSSGRW